MTGEPASGATSSSTRAGTAASRTQSPGAPARRRIHLAARLPSPRDVSFFVGIEAAVAFVRGRALPRDLVTSSRALLTTKAARTWVRRARRALDAGDLDEAINAAASGVAADPTSIQALTVLRDAQARRGDLTAQIPTIRRLRSLDDTPERRANERRLLGRLVETSPGWVPRIPGPPRPSVPEPGDPVVMHLLKESLPYRTTGYTIRSQANMLAAARAGVRPVVVTQLGFPRALGIDGFASAEAVGGITHHRLDLGAYYPLDAPYDVLLRDQAWQSAAVGRLIRPAVIHASSGQRGYEAALVGLALREHLARPLVYEVRSFFEATWSSDERWRGRGEQWQRRHDTESRLMRQADHVITIADTMRAEIIGRGVDPQSVTVIPNGVDADAFVPEEADATLHDRYRLHDRFVFGYVSNLDHARENQELLVEATAILRARGRRVRCLIVGDGTRRSVVEAAAKAAGVSDEVVFTGLVPHDEVLRHYALMDAFVVPRRDEPASRTVTPLKPYEALAMARPLIVADLPALVEIAAPGDRGLTFPAGDAAALASTIEILIDDPALGRRMGEAGRAWVVRERSWHANGPRFRAVYDEVLGRWQHRQHV